MAALSKKYPGDVEAKVFHALALNEIFDHKSMAPLEQAIAILTPLDKRYLDHPGITHYLIHSYDFAPVAQRGLPAADKCAKVANEYAAQSKLDGVLGGVPHVYDFMQYAYLQLDQDQKAHALTAQSAELAGKKIIGGASVISMARSAIKARYFLERQDWAGAAQLKPLNLPFPAADAITHFARALGAAHLSEVAAAQADIARTDALRAARSADHRQPALLGRAGRGAVAGPACLGQAGRGQPTG